MDRKDAKQIGMPPFCYESVVRALAVSGDPRAIEPLIDYMRMGPFGRDSVPYSLAYFGHPAVAPLIVLLHDPNEKTRSLAAQTLTAI